MACTRLATAPANVAIAQDPDRLSRYSLARRRAPTQPPSGCEPCGGSPSRKYKIAARTNSPSDATEHAACRWSAGLGSATSSGNNRLSRPAAREWIQRSFPHAPNAARSNSRVPDHCRITVASFPAHAHAAASPHTECGNSLSMANCGSSLVASTSTGFSFPIILSPCPSSSPFSVGRRQSADAGGELASSLLCRASAASARAPQRGFESTGPARLATPALPQASRSSARARSSLRSLTSSSPIFSRTMRWP
jgi:hypothetical protein